MENWVNIISFTYPHEAHMAKGFLEASDIEVIIKDELTVQVNNLYSNALGGVKLMVQTEKAEEALSLLEEAGYIIKNAEEQKTPIESFSAEYKTLCPYCKSTNITKKKMAGYTFALSILLLGFPIPFLKTTYNCYDCQRECRIKKEQ